MTLIDFVLEFTDEQCCKQKFKECREQVGAVCLKCGSIQYYWKKDKETI